MQKPRKLIDDVTKRTDRAVSPVIGVILMVAITVILAAVIGTFVLDLGSKVESTAPSVSWSVEDGDDGISATGNEDIILISFQSVSETNDLTDYELQLSYASNSSPIATFALNDYVPENNLVLYQNGTRVINNNQSQFTVSSGDSILIREHNNTNTGALQTNTKVQVQLLFVGGNEAKVVAQAKVQVQ